MAHLGRPVLTIAIPTYNRSEKVLMQLNRLIHNFSSDVQIIIRDNASRPTVESVLTNMHEHYNIKVITNKFNIGGDANISRCFEECDSDWLWVLSDDDFVSDDAINQVLELIDKYSEYCYINFSSTNSKKTLALKGFHEFVHALKDNTTYINSFWISTCLYNMSILRNDMLHYYKALSSMQGQLVLVLKCLEANPNGKCVFVNSNIIAADTKETSWSRVDFINNSTLIVDLFKKENELDIKKTFFNTQLLVLCYFLMDQYLKYNISRRYVIKNICLFCLKSDFYAMIDFQIVKKIIQLLVVISIPQKLTIHIMNRFYSPMS